MRERTSDSDRRRFLAAACAALVAMLCAPLGAEEPKPPAANEAKWIWRPDSPRAATGRRVVAIVDEYEESAHDLLDDFPPAASAPKVDSGQELCFRRAFNLPAQGKVRSAVFAVTADGSCRVAINGANMGDKTGDWRTVWGVKARKALKPGANVIAVISAKPSGHAGVVGRLTVTLDSGERIEVVTDGKWKCSDRKTADWAAAQCDDASWPAAKELGPLGIPPWNKLVLQPTPPPVAWPETPPTRPLTKEQGEALLRADWLMQVHNDPTLARLRDEIEAARAIAARLAAHPKRPSFSNELVELTQLAAKVEAIEAEEEVEDEHRDLYLAIRTVKRRIVFRNPVVDFERVLLIDGAPPQGHESGHRNTFGGDLPAIGRNRIVALDALCPEATAREVVPIQGGRVMRMDLDFDASRLVYSLYAPPAERSYHLYEVALNAEGTAAGPVKQLTNSLYNDMDPIYLPDGKIAFCTSRGNTYVRCLPNSPCTVLARCDADGSNIRLTSINNEPDYTPAVLPDGRVLYTRWEYTDRPLWRLQKLWTANPDGTQVSHYWGNRSYYPDLMWEARPIPGTTKVMFTGVGHHQVAGGPIGIIDINEGRDFPDGIYKVTMEIPWTEVGDPKDPAQNRPYSPNYRACAQYRNFGSPYPLSPDDFLVSASGPRRPFGLYLMDVHGNRELIYMGTEPGGVWCALPLRPRTRAPVIPDRAVWPKAGEQPADGMLFSANVLQGMDGDVANKARYLRIIQQDAKTYSMGFKSFRHSGPIISALQEDAVKRILGTVPIQSDGSVAFRLPPSQAVYFQLLDEDQRCLQSMRSFAGVLPGETRGCLGCHELHSTGQANLTARVLALRQPAQRPAPPPWGAEVSVGFERFVQPVLDKHCAKCHQGDGKARATLDLTLRGGLKERGIEDPKLLPFKEPYLTLIGQTSWGVRGVSLPKVGVGCAGAFPVESLHLYGPVKPMTYFSYTSPLINLVMSGKHNGVKVQGEDLLRLIAWVDANCVYRGEEEVREIPDPEPEAFPTWTIPPKTRTAPIIDRTQVINDPPPAPPATVPNPPAASATSTVGKG